MTATPAKFEYSKSRINKAGRVFRKWWNGDLDDVTPEILRRELQVIDHFRGLHAEPLKKVAANMRYYVAQHSTTKVLLQPIVAQRLKRMRTIIDKLGREPTMALSRMHDVGGCRALFSNSEEIYELVAHLDEQKRWDIKEVRDYIANPKSHSGYRAVHVIVRKDGLLIEIQLRSVSQHSWAELVEMVDRRTGVGLKAHRAPADVTEYYRLGASLLAGTASEEKRVRFQNLHESVQQQLLDMGS